MIIKMRQAAMALLIPAMLLAGCTANAGQQVYDNEDLLGSDYDRYNSEYFSQSSEGNTLIGSAENLEGMRTIRKFNSEGTGEIRLEYDLSVSSGKAKIVLLAPDGTFTVPAECTAEDEEITGSEQYRALKGEYRIKMVGAEDTKLKYEITVNTDTGS